MLFVGLLAQRSLLCPRFSGRAIITGDGVLAALELQRAHGIRRDDGREALASNPYLHLGRRPSIGASSMYPDSRFRALNPPSGSSFVVW